MQYKEKMRINKLTLYSILVFLPFLEPSYFVRNSIIHKVFLILRLISYMMVIYKVSTNYRKKKPSFAILLIFLLFFQLLVSTYINGVNTISAFQYMIKMIPCIVYVDSFDKGRIKYVIKALVIILSIYIYINFITVILFPSGLYVGDKVKETYYFLGHNNSAIKFLLPAIIFRGLYEYLEYNRITCKTYIIAIISILTVIITWSNTAMIGIGIMVLYIFILRKIKINYILKVLFFLPIVLFLILVLQNQLQWLSYIIVDLFGKEMSLTGRVDIWNLAIKAISRRPLWGYGYDVKLYEIENMFFEPSSCHNYFLDLLFRGGIFQLVIQLILNWVCCISLSKKITKESKLLGFGILSYFIIWQVEVFTFTGVPLMFIIFILAYNINRDSTILKNNK